MPTAPKISAKAVLDDPSESSLELFAFSGLGSHKSAPSPAFARPTTEEGLKEELDP